MAAGKLTTQDRKDLDRFTKFLIYKSLQIIVQSRLGEKVKTKSKSVSSGSDWFNLAIRDMSEVQTEAKKSVTWSQLSVGQYVCVETSLKTAEGDSMVLETWYIQVTEQTDPNARVSYTVYNRMGIALKSLYSVTRVTPAYKLSRRQGADNYIICYRVYCTEPQFCQLGEGYQTTKVGCVPTPAGTVNINVAYRVKLLISPQKTSKEVPFEVKDDHFKPDTSPKRTTTPKPCRLGYRRESVCEDLSSQQDAQEGCSTTFSTSPPDIGPLACPANSNIPQSQPIQIQARQPQDSRPDEFRPHSTPERSSFPFSTGYKVGAFAQARSPKDLKSDLEDVPFCNLLQQQPGREKTDVPLQTSASKLQGSRKSLSADNMDNVGTSSGSASGSTKSVSSVSMASAPEDFVMVELKTPFAGTDTNSDLNKFYRECQGAPPLSMFEDQTDVNQTLNEITDQLAMFESSMNDFDSFVSSLHEDD